MSTIDRQSWKTVATGQYVDLAALPSRGDRVLATTPAGEVHEVRLTGDRRGLRELGSRRTGAWLISQATG
jgi:hypothetical protein